MICSFKRADGLMFITDKPINVMKLGRCIRRSDHKQRFMSPYRPEHRLKPRRKRPRLSGYPYHGCRAHTPFSPARSDSWDPRTMHFSFSVSVSSGVTPSAFSNLRLRIAASRHPVLRQTYAPRPFAFPRGSIKSPFSPRTMRMSSDLSFISPQPRHLRCGLLRVICRCLRPAVKLLCILSAL